MTPGQSHIHSWLSLCDRMCLALQWMWHEQRLFSPPSLAGALFSLFFSLPARVQSVSSFTHAETLGPHHTWLMQVHPAHKVSHKLPVNKVKLRRHCYFVSLPLLLCLVSFQLYKQVYRNLFPFEYCNRIVMKVARSTGNTRKVIARGTTRYRKLVKE